MLKAGITVGCAAAMLVAAVLSVRLRDTRRSPSPLSGQEPFAERVAVTAGRAGGMLAGALIAGVLTIGAGGRLMMRILAATSSDEVQGLQTDAEEVIGEVSVDGSVFLILALGIGAGALGLALFTLLRRWLPDRSAAAGLIGVAIGAGLLVRPSGLLTSSNRDFTLLSPVILAVALPVVMLVLFGTTFGVLVDRLAPRWPRPGWSLRGVGSLLPFVALAAAPPLFVAVVVGVLLGAVVVGRRAPVPGGSVEPADRRGRKAIAALSALGAVSVAVAAGQVLAL